MANSTQIKSQQKDKSSVDHADIEEDSRDKVKEIAKAPEPSLIKDSAFSRNINAKPDGAATSPKIASKNLVDE